MNLKKCEVCGQSYGPKYGQKQFDAARTCSLKCAAEIGRSNRKWKPVSERFWEKVDKRPGHGPNGDCWVWTASRLPAGYGTFRLKDRVQKAHRVSFMLHVGDLPEDRMIRHDCDNPACVNPAHLRIGEHFQNMKDMVDRGRGRAPSGIAHHSKKLTEDQVRAIRSDLRKQREIAADYGVTQGAVAAIKSRRTWKHLD